MVDQGVDYRPWRDAATRAELEVMVCDLPSGVRAIHARSPDGHRAILISRALDPVERLAALAHELVHDERGGGCHQPHLPARMRPLVTRDETAVDRIAADRLLPLDRLDRWVALQEAADRPVTVAWAAAELDVAGWVAEIQLRRLQAARAGRRQVA